MSEPFAAPLPVAGRPVTVVGGGPHLLGHVVALRDAGAEVTVVAPTVTAAVADLAARGLLQWQARAYEKGDLHQAWLVLAGTGDRDLDRRVAADCEGQRLWCVTVRPPELQPRAGVGRVTLVGGGPGDPGLLTLAGRDALRSADVVVADRLGPVGVLPAVAPQALVVDVGKVPGGRATPQEEINRLLVEHARAGRHVVRLKGGDSFVFGRGLEELQACAAAGVGVSVVPGVTSAFAVPAAAGIPATHRGLTQAVTIVSGHVPPDDPRCTVDYAALARAGTSLVLLMAVTTLPQITAALLDAGLASDTPAATVADGTLTSQRVVRGRLADIASRVTEAGLTPPAVTVIGAVAAFAADGSS